jgi:cell division protein FtsQ
MKRPQGFDRPATPSPPVESSAARRPAAERPALATRARRSLRPRAGDKNSAAQAAEPSTEPIAVPAGAGKAPAPVAPVSPPHADTGTTTAAEARAAFRAARRARKRYERDEVRRFTWRARRRRRAWLVGIGVFALLVLFTLIGAFSPLMALRTVEVTGTSRIPAAQVQAALADQLGTPLPLLDAGKIKAELGRFTLIRSFVTESRPPGTLVVRIVERAPVGVIPSPAGFDLVDAAGVVIQSTGERPAGYPALDTGGVGSPGFLAAAEVIDSLPESMRSRLDTVTAATTDDVTLSLAGGARVVWGSAEKSEYKAVVLAALMVAHPVGSVKEYDVSSPDSAVLR